jgi:SLOG in TRPM, prokaryote
MEVPSLVDSELREMRTGGRPVLLTRSGPVGSDQFHTPQVQQDAKACVSALGLSGHHPVMVVVGGADKLGQDEGLTDKIRKAMDLALVTSAEGARAVVLTGGTGVGIMKLAGESFADRGALALVGVAPRSRVIAANVNPIPENTAVLDANHSSFVLTSGPEWGSETETLFELAEEIAGDRRSGVVVLADGGDVSRQEVRRFLEAGWPVITLDGSGRAADSLAAAVREEKQDRRFRKQRKGATEDGWGSLAAAQVEIHRLGAQSVERLQRQLSWHLSDGHLLKNSLGSWASYEAASISGQRLASRAQGLTILLAGTLTVGAVLQGAYIKSDDLKWLLVTLPVLVALNGSIIDSLLPRRSWMVMRSAAQAVERAIYRYRARVADAGSDLDADDALVLELAAIRQRVLKAGVRNLTAAPVGRPDRLSSAYDELAMLTVREYSVIRLDGQLKYYRDAATRLERRQLETLAGSAALAAISTWAASEVFAAVWVPVLVLVGATLVIAQQRARWKDRVVLYEAALGDLHAERDRQFLGGRVPNILVLVGAVEGALERESSGWLQSMDRPESLPLAFG